MSAIPRRETYIIDLARGCAANGVSDTNSVDANLVNRTVERQKIDEVGAERVLARNCQSQERRSLLNRGPHTHIELRDPWT